MAAKDPNFEKLEIALAMEEPDDAFEAAHALKGVLGNLALTPLFEPANEMCELLRGRTEMDYDPLLEQLMQDVYRDRKDADIRAWLSEEH